MAPFSTTVFIQIRLIRDLVTIYQLLQSYLAPQRRQLDLLEQYNLMLEKLSSKVAMPARNGKGTQQTSKNEFRSILKFLKHHKQVAIAIMHRSSLFLRISKNTITLRHRDFRALLLYVAHALQQYTIGSTSISTNRSALLRLKKRGRLLGQDKKRKYKIGNNKKQQTAHLKLSKQQW